MMKQLYIFIANRLRKLALFALGGIAACAAQAQDITTGLKLHYTFDGLTGTTVTDVSGNNNAGTLMGNATLGDGFSGQGATCTVKADYISAPANINVGLTSFTFATWVKFSALKNATRFFDWGNGADATNNFLAFIPSYNADDAFMVLRYRPVSGSAVNVTSTSKCPVGTWAHVALTFSWNSSTNTATATFYLNGEPVGSASGLTFNPSASLGSTANNYFGYSRWAQDTNGFNGTFDDLRVYNRALTAADVMALCGLQNLNLQYNALNIGNLSAVTGNLALPTQGPDFPEVAISWSSSNTNVIAANGQVTRPSYFNFPVTLTATLSVGQFSKAKTFSAVVLANDGTAFANDLLVRYDFSNLTDRTVADVAEKGFTGTLVNQATVRTIGTETTGIYNVLDLGNGSGYFDMGAEVGKVVSLLGDYSMSAYFRVENEYTGLSGLGNFLWNFSNSQNAGTSQNGYIIAKLNDQSVSITPGYYTATSGNQTVSVGSEALKGNWHHIAYTQKGGTGTVYIDGIAMMAKAVSNKPVGSLIKDGMMGTPYNWLGRSCYPTDAYLRRTMVYDFRIYNKALTGAEILTSELKVPETIALLEAAYNAFVATGKTSETQLAEKTYHPTPSTLIVELSGQGAKRYNLSELKKLTFSDLQTNFLMSNQTTESWDIALIDKMTFAQESTSLAQANANKMAVWPNPAYTFIEINGTDNQPVAVYSMNGQLMLQLPKGPAPRTIDVSALPSGLYLVKSGRLVAKFTKK